MFRATVAFTAAATAERVTNAAVSKAPVVAREPAEMAPSRDTLKRVDTLMDMGNVRTHLRALMPVLDNAIADALDFSVNISKTRLDWWPRKDDKQVWSLRIQLPYEMRRREDKRTRPDPFARPTTMSLPSFLCKRDKVSTDTHLAHLVVMLEMEESARAAFDAYMSKNKPKELGGDRWRQPPSLLSLGSHRAAPRVPPSAAEFSARQVVPLPAGAKFYNTPIRPRDHVFDGSKHPTHLTRIPPPPLLAPLPPSAPPATGRAASRSTTPVLPSARRVHGRATTPVLQSSGRGRGKTPARKPVPAASPASAASAATQWATAPRASTTAGAAPPSPPALAAVPPSPPALTAVTPPSPASADVSPPPPASRTTTRVLE